MGEIKSRKGKCIINWAESNFTLGEGSRVGEFINITDDSPWMIEPLKAITDDTVRSIAVAKSAGGGGTYLLMIAAAYCQSVLGKTCIAQAPQKEKAMELANRLWSQIDSCKVEELRKSSDKYDTTKTSRYYKISPSFLFCQAANLTNSNSTRSPFVFLDETWLIDPAIREGFKSRMVGTDYTKFMDISTADQDTDGAMHIAFEGGTREEFHVCCPKCKGHFIPLIGEISKKTHGAYTIQWDNSQPSNELKAQSAKAVCPHCGFESADDRRSKNKLLEGAKYIKTNPNAHSSNRSYRFNSFIPPFVTYKFVVEKFLDAYDRAKTGDVTALKDFYIKQLAIAWSDDNSGDKDDWTPSNCYELIEATSPVGKTYKSEPLDNLRMRAMAVDVQHRFLWVKCLDVDEEQNVRLVWAGKLNNFEEVELMREWLQVEPHCVAVDVGTWGLKLWKVYEQCAKYGYIGMEGVKQDDGFPHIYEDYNADGVLEKFIDKLPFSKVQYRDPGIGTSKEGKLPEVRVIKWSNKLIKGQFAALRSNSLGRKLMLPKNIHMLHEDSWAANEGILKQLDAEVLVKEVIKKTKKVEEFYKKRSSSAHDHLSDCFCMCLVLFTNEFVDG